MSETTPHKRQHITDGRPCWCGPIAKKERGAIIWIHRQIPECSECDNARAALAAKDEELRRMERSRDEALTKWHAHQKNVPCAGCAGGHDTFWKSVVESPQWKAWCRVAEWDTAECEACGHISPGHFQAFLAFVCQPRPDGCSACGDENCEDD